MNILEIIFKALAPVLVIMAILFACFQYFSFYILIPKEQQLIREYKEMKADYKKHQEDYNLTSDVFK